MRIRIFISIALIHTSSWAQQVHLNRGFKTNSCYQIRSLLTCKTECRECSLTLYPETTARLEMDVKNFKNICTGKDLKMEGIAFFKILSSADHIELFDVRPLNRSALKIYKQVEQLTPKALDCPK